jgi:hypothetical protein
MPTLDDDCAHLKSMIDSYHAREATLAGYSIAGQPDPVLVSRFQRIHDMLWYMVSTWGPGQGLTPINYAGGAPKSSTPPRPA